VHTSALGFLGGVGILLLFSWALSWGFALVGLLVANTETAQVAVFPILMPFTFASSAFVPVASMPGWLQAFARPQPFSQVVDACRALMEGGPTLTHVEAAVAWTVGMLAAFGPLAVWRFRRSV
jgi:ABC-type multidrug transport system permease subunit